MPPPPSPLSAFLLQYLVFLFPVTLVFVSLFGYIGGYRPSYFSKKRNIFNMLFVKNGCGWTSLAFLVYLAVVFGKALVQQDQFPNNNETGSGISTARTRSSLDQDHHHHNNNDSNNINTPAPIGTNLLPRGSNTSAKIPSSVIVKALTHWGLATLYWWIISHWFFGAGLFDRVFVLTGGSCSIDGHWSQSHCRRQGEHWSGGIDISGHMFLLMHAWIFLMEELSIFLNVPEAWTALQNRTTAKYAVFGTLSLMSLWWWMLLMTSVY